MGETHSAAPAGCDISLATAGWTGSATTTRLRGSTSAQLLISRKFDYRFPDEMLTTRPQELAPDMTADRRLTRMARE
jgi:hypothetical protein